MICLIQKLSLKVEFKDNFWIKQILLKMYPTRLSSFWLIESSSNVFSPAHQTHHVSPPAMLFDGHKKRDYAAERAHCHVTRCHSRQLIRSLMTSWWWRGREPMAARQPCGWPLYSQLTDWDRWPNKTVHWVRGSCRARAKRTNTNSGADGSRIPSAWIEMVLGEQRHFRILESWV